MVSRERLCVKRFFRVRVLWFLNWLGGSRVEVLLHLLYQVLEKRQRNKITNLHVPPSLAHHPDGGPLDGLAAEGAEHQRVRGGALFLSLRESRG